MPPFLSGYTKRWKVTVDHTKVGDTLSDFPVYVNLAHLDADFWNTVQNGGGDIRVTRADGQTECAREVVSCDTTAETGELHFLANSLSDTTDTDFYIYANGVSADYAVTDTYGRNAVWAGGFVAVLHGNGLVDSTGNHTVTQNGTVSYTAGKLGNGFNLPGNGSNYPIINHSTLLNFTTDMYFSAWLSNNAVSSRRSHFSKGSWTVNTGYWLHTDIGQRSLQISTPGLSFSGFRIEKAGGYNADPLHHFVYRKTQGSGMSYHVDGVLENTVNNANANRTMNTNTLNLFIGRRTDAADAWLGLIDEVRLSATPYPDDWISTEYANQSSPANFYNIGAMEEPVNPNVPLDPFELLPYDPPAGDEVDFNFQTSQTFDVLVAASIAVGGSINRVANRIREFSAGVTYSGSVQKTSFFNVHVGALVLWAGTTAKNTTRNILVGAQVAYNGSVTRLKVKVQNVIAGVRYTGTVAKNTLFSRSVTASVAYDSSVSRTKVIFRTVVGGVLYSGSVTKTVAKTLVGAITQSGAVTKSLSLIRKLSGVVQVVGNTHRRLTASRSFAGILKQVATTKAKLVWFFIGKDTSDEFTSIPRADDADWKTRDRASDDWNSKPKSK